MSNTYNPTALELAYRRRVRGDSPLAQAHRRILRAMAEQQLADLATQNEKLSSGVPTHN